MRTLIEIFILLVVLSNPALAESKISRIEKIEKKIFQLVNEARGEEGLAPLKWNDKLGDASNSHLEWVINAKRLSHQFPGEAVLRTRVAATGLRFNAVAENVAYATDWEDLHSGLMRSPSHRANILNSKYNAIGIAVALGPNGYYAVENFARVTSEFSPEESERKFANAYLRLPQTNQVDVTANAGIRKAMCEMAESDRLDARKLPSLNANQRMFTYTAFDPGDLPEKLANDPRPTSGRQINVGICYRATSKYPGGVYWIGVVY